MLNYSSRCSVRTPCDGQGRLIIRHMTSCRPRALSHPRKESRQIPTSLLIVGRRSSDGGTFLFAARFSLGQRRLPTGPAEENNGTQRYMWRRAMAHTAVMWRRAMAHNAVLWWRATLYLYCGGEQWHTTLHCGGEQGHTTLYRGEQ